MKKGAFFAAIDVGTSKVCTLVGRLDAAREMQVVGVGLAPSRGMKKGMVSNISDVQTAVRASVLEAETQAGVNSISSASVGIPFPNEEKDQNNLVEALHRAGVTARVLVLEPLASAEAVLVGEEREMGVVLVNIGGAISTVSIFLGGNIRHTGIIPIGGFQFTQDVSIAFTTPFQAAEEAKVRYGHAIPEIIGSEEVIRLPGFAEGLDHNVPQQNLCQVLRKCMEELLRMVLAQIRESGLEVAPPGGLVLTGGSAKMPGLEELARTMFPGPVRIGVPKATAWVPRNLEDPSFATALGLLLWDARTREEKKPPSLKQRVANLTRRVHI